MIRQEGGASILCHPGMVFQNTVSASLASFRFVVIAFSLCHTQRDSFHHYNVVQARKPDLHKRTSS